MKVTIDITNALYERARKLDMDKNIDALTRCINGESTPSDTNILIDTKSILTGIREQLPER